jgi:hypothetical protein
MSQKPPLSESLKAFLKDGIEPALCIICTNPFSGTHVAVQIKEWGHHFGEACLEKWLAQKKTRGTCPTCRGILFQEPTSDSSPDYEPGLAPPVSPAQFFEYYSLTANVLNSARAGFLRQLWDYIHRHMTDESAAPIVALDTWQQVVNAYARMGAADSDSRRKFTTLAPYVERLSNIESENGCVLCWLAETLWKLTKLCKSGLSGPPDFMWGAILFVHTDPNRTLPVFELPDLRKAIWARSSS